MELRGFLSDLGLEVVFRTFPDNILPKRERKWEIRTGNHNWLAFLKNVLHVSHSLSKNHRAHVSKTQTRKSPGARCVCIPQLHLSMSERLPPAPSGAWGRSSGSGRWCNAPALGPEPPPGKTEPQAGPSAEPVRETGSGPASQWGSTVQVPAKTQETPS